MTTRKNQTVVTRLAPGQIDWEEEDTGPATSIARRPNNFVPAAPAAPAFQLLPPEAGGAAPLVQPNAIVETRVTGDHLTRAKGFALVSSILAAVVGVLAVIVGMVGFGTPLLSLPILGWFWGAFAGVWLLAWGMEKLMSPDGAAVLHIWGLWGYMKREQKERWAFYNRQLDRWEDR